MTIERHPQSGPEADQTSLEALTGRQREVAVLVATGMTNRMIANRLGIAEWTVVNHLRQVMTRLKCPSRLHVALMVERESHAQNDFEAPHAARTAGDDLTGDMQHSA